MTAPGEGNPAAVAVEPVAARLGAIKGVGHDQLAARLPGLLPLDEPDQLTNYLDAFTALLLADAPAPA
ncbi:hypothetical protein KCMC57_up12760 [Kitasatospora sp. CMC57]|uniref:Uncharacterized protein n=1 Tax=Kitasatospora sp. CMC57 TaxID=3231513 RepID=A0AB33JNT1_9ACTN